MTSIRATKFVISIALAGTWLIGAQAHALAYVGTFLTDSNQYTLIHEGANPGATNDADDWLRFLPGQTFNFDITGSMLSATGPQTYNLASNNGDTALFVLQNLTLDLSGPNGLAGGSLTYTLDSVAGTFTFIEQIYGTSNFNSSSYDGSTFTAFIWGGDATNALGFDGAFEANPVPVPGALVLFGSALAGLGLRRKKS